MSDVTLKHNYTSFKADGSDPTQVRASNWNEPHIYIGGTDGQVLVRDFVSTTGASWIPKTTAGIDVSFYATGGTGASATPWTGWDTAITWTAETEYHFKSGWYSYATSPNYLQWGIALIGESGTVLKHTGTGNAVVFDSPTTWLPRIRFENFVIEGNPNTTNGLFLRGITKSYVKNVSVRNVSAAGVRTEAMLGSVLENIIVSRFETVGAVWTTRPQEGIHIGTRVSDGATCTTMTVINPVIEDVSVYGIFIDAANFSNTIINGGCEDNTASGCISLLIKGYWNTVINTEFEANGANLDIELNNARNVLMNVASAGSVSLTGGGCNQLIGGSYHNITIASNVHQTIIQGAEITGTLTENETNKTSMLIGNAVAGGFKYQQVLNNVVGTGLVTSTLSSGLVATDCWTATNWYWQASANFTLSNPTHGVNGTRIRWRFEQDATGSRIISYDTKFVAVAGGSLPVLQTTALAVDEITAVYDSLRDKWRVYPITSW